MPVHFRLFFFVAISVGFLTGFSDASFAIEKGDWLLRLRGIVVAPTDESTGGIRPDLTTTGLEAQAAVVPEVDITYMVTDNIGIELIAATSNHDFDATGALSNLNESASAWLLPPTLLVVYHFLPRNNIRPYIGAGINYTITYGENASASLENALGGPTDVDADNSFGFAIQAGVDIDINDRWFFNADVKYIDMSVDIDLTTAGTVRTIEVGLDPIIFGVGVGYRF